MPNNTALALQFGDMIKDTDHPRDGILFYSNAAKNITEIDDETESKKDHNDHKDKDENNHTPHKFAEDLSSFGITDVATGDASDALKFVTNDTS